LDEGAFMLFKEIKAEFELDLKKWEYTAYASILENVDLAKERVKKGAFKKTIQERFDRYKDEGKSKIKAFWLHQSPMGLPLHIEEDEKGLLTHTRVSKTDENKNRLIYMKDGVVDQMSIGYDVIKDSEADDEVRDLNELKLYEYSPVPFGCNEATYIIDMKSAMGLLGVMDRAKRILDKKAVVPYGDLPLDSREKEWDADGAVGRVRKWAGGPDKEEIDWGKYSKAFMWYDSDDSENFSAYKLPIADVVGGSLKAVPRGLFAVAGVLQGARGGVDIPSGDVDKVKSVVEKYYAKMRKEFDDEDIVAPWNKSIVREFGFLDSEKLKSLEGAVGILNEIISGQGIKEDKSDSIEDIAISTIKELREMRDKYFH
jgi:HK97 family phage prohead protease